MAPASCLSGIDDPAGAPIEAVVRIAVGHERVRGRLRIALDGLAVIESG
jgi:hypothetical protein